ncbi:MAG: hypothetical protein D6734_01935, partial [Candidatus Schekmanbacteria bacterium]
MNILQKYWKLKKLKVLLCHKFLFDNGGSERFLFQLEDILKKKNHEVSFFSMNDKRNRESPYSKYFVSNINYANNSLIYQLTHSLKTISRFIYSFESKKKIEELIRDIHPDIAHINLIYHHISPSILYALKKHNIPVVMNVNDCKLVCPNYYLYNPVSN